MRVHLVDPAAYTPPYDHALAAALAQAGADVTLVTGPFAHGAVPQISPRPAYRVDERFYRWTPARARRAARLAQHVPDMLRYRLAARAADVVHWQWLPVQPVDVRLLPSGRPRVLTAHDVLPREPRSGQRSAQRRLYERMDAVVVHSEHGRGRLVAELGLDVDRVEVIPHGAFTHLTQLPDERPLPTGLAAVEGPVVLFFGLLRPYKGLDVLLEAWHGIGGAELWIAGAPRGVDVGALRAAAPGNVRFEPRFITDPEIPALFRRADLVVLPYREIDQSGVLFTALAFGTPILASAVGGFPEVAAHGAAELVPPGDPAALHEALVRLVGDAGRRDELGRAARAAADTEYGWDAIAARHTTLYERLMVEGA
jgi:glycosyltransferase involved in cell wall biosynthesis